MGLRCLIGHDFGDPQIERDRDEQGEEVVVTIREYTECTRCGHRRTISENKEVTSIASSEPEETDPGSDADAPGAEQVTGDETSVDETFDDVSAAEDDGVILDDEPGPERQRGEWPDSGIEADDTGRTAADVDTQPTARADDATSDTSDGEREDEDGIIDADDEREDEDRSGTAEQSESDAADDADGWPEVDDPDEGFAAETTGGEAADAEFGSEYSIDPTTDGSANDEAVIGSTGTTTSHAETTDGPSGEEATTDESGAAPTQRQRMADADTVFVCPECGYTTPASGASLRPGDICPECQRGYLSESEE